MYKVLSPVFLFLSLILVGCSGGSGGNNDSNDAGKSDNIPDDIVSERKLNVEPASWVTFGPYTLTGFDDSVTLSSGSVSHQEIESSTIIDNSQQNISEHVLVSINGGDFQDAVNLAVFENDTVAISYQVSDYNYALSTASVNLANIQFNFESETAAFNGDLFITGNGGNVVLGRLSDEKELSVRNELELEANKDNDSIVIHSLDYDKKNNLIYAVGSHPCTVGNNQECAGDATIEVFQHSDNVIRSQQQFYHAEPMIKTRGGLSENILIVVFSNNSSVPITINSVGLLHNDPIDYQESTNCGDDIELNTGDECLFFIGLETPSLLAGTSIKLITSIGNYIAPIDNSDDNILAVWQPYLDGQSTASPACSQKHNIKYDRDGNCYFSSIHLSADGSKIYITEKSMNTLLTFAVSDTDIKFVSETNMSANALSGVVTTDAGNVLYNGSSVYSVDSEGTTSLQSTGVNAMDSDIYPDINSTPYLLTAADSTRIELYDITTDPLSPTLLVSDDMVANSADYLDAANYLDDIFVGGEIADVPTLRHLKVVNTNSSWSISEYASTPLDFFPDCNTECGDTSLYIRGIDSDDKGQFILVSGTSSTIDNSLLNGPEDTSVVFLMESQLTGELTERNRLYLNDYTTDIILLP